MALQAIEEFQAACQDAAAHQRAELAAIFKLNACAAHLRKHGIPEAAALSADQQDVEALLAQLPLTSYSDYGALMAAAVQVRYCSLLRPAHGRQEAQPW